MARGPGKYDDVCTFVREHVNAEACLIVIVNGDQGDGMSFQTSDKALEAQIPQLLRRVARDIENEVGDEGQAPQNDLPVLPS